MPADRDRFSYDEKQQYRSVVAQQGRVTVPADWNEAQEIFAEEQRREALDIVGPAGTPDDGYRIEVPQSSPNYDFLVEPGSVYVGGERVFLPQQISYFTQPDWIDAPPPKPDPVLEFIYLQLQEQEVSAVEDSTLKDVALGGPDTTQRTRLLQHIVRTPTQAKTCPEALAQQLSVWLSQGLTFDPATMRLNSASRLKVGFDQSGPPPDTCEPTASGGYLGAENQLIRVRLTSPNEFTWGFDDSSFFYRVDVIDNQTLRLQTPPVDSFHQPRANQAIEILRSEALLSDGEYIAYDIGRVDTLAAAYNADTQTITLPAPLTPEFLPPKGTPRLFVRVWEQSLTFVAGTPITLGNTGVQVTLTANVLGIFHVGDFWAFAVRPSTTVEVYPHRYLDDGQPPEGPRLWACPLAILAWSAIGGTAGNIVTGQRTADCREHFDNLVELTKREGGCCACTVCVTPQQHINNAPSIQMAIDQVIKLGGGTVCLMAGQYPLNVPLRIDKARSLRLVGTGEESRLVSELSAIEVTDSHDVTLESFSVESGGGSTTPGSVILLSSSSQLRLAHLMLLAPASPAGPGWSGIGLSGALDGVTIRGCDLATPAGIVNAPVVKPQATGVVDLCIEDNRFACAEVAVRLSDVTVLQQVSRIGGNRVTGCQVAGFELTCATVPGFGIEVIANELRVAGHGIVSGVSGLRAIDNDLIGQGPTATDTRGILLTKSFATDRMDDVQIAGNRITEFGSGIFAEVRLGAVTIAHNQIARTAIGVVVTPVPVESLSITANQMVEIIESAMLIDSSEGRVAVSGNQLHILAGNVGVRIMCKSGDCVYSDNHSQHIKGGQADGVALVGRTLIVTSNRVVERVRMSIGPQGSQTGPLCTVVGNITGGDIRINGAPIPAPWTALNLQNV